MEKTLAAQLVEQEGNASAAARAVGVSPQRFHFWRTRPLPEDGHLRCWLALDHHGRKALKRWLASAHRIHAG